jgi:hypothetical protein
LRTVAFICLGDLVKGVVVVPITNYKIMNTLESCQQIYTYDTGNNLTSLSHQAHSSAWQQTLSIHPNNLGVVFAVFAEDMGADVQGVGLLLCFVN